MERRSCPPPSEDVSPLYSDLVRHTAPRGVPERYGRTALVAGASEGIGAAFARTLARRGFDLVLVARRREPLTSFARSLGTDHRADVLPVPLDLGAPDAAERLWRSCDGREIGLLVYNAAAAALGPFLERPLEDHVAAIDVNVRAPLALAHRFGRSMASRGRGGIVLMSSLSGFQGTPLVATYAATKAFDLVLAEGLWDELRGRGVDVLACCAGATSTPGYERSAPAGRASRFAPRVQRPEEVAEAALRALGRRPSVVCGPGNALASIVMRRLLSRRSAVLLMGREMRSRYGARDSG